MTVSQSRFAFVAMYNFCPPPIKDKRMAILHYATYIPIIGMIAAIGLLILARKWASFMLKGEMGEPFRALAARFVVTAIALGPLLILVDLIGTIMQAAWHIKVTPTLENKLFYTQTT